MTMKVLVGCALSCGLAGGEMTPLAPGASLHGFTVKSVTELPEVKGRLVRMTYEKNGADLAWLDRDDDNKTFAIVFRTIPEDDTGVAHILEHSVLCGSEKYPVKEPFVELLKSSFSTFLNAFTSSDWTAYPVCSRNNADFLNLMDVYLDAVFHPLSVKSPLPFRQEGWHYEVKGGELTRNGVVLSEMKGAFGNPERLAYHELHRLLFPDNCYGFVSGGDPASIHKLTFEQYKDFYRRHYHPSNARIFLDGRVDLPTTLAKLDSYLSAYPRTEVKTAVPLQTPVQAEKTIPYEIGADDSAADKTLLAEGWVIGTFRDRETHLAFDVLSDVLASSNEDPLKKALLEKNLCEDVNLGVGGAEQLTATLFVKNAKDGKADAIRQVVRETFARLAKDGLDHARLNAVLDRHEFNDREKDSGGFPRGLLFFEDALDQWLYGGDPADAFRSEGLYRSLRAKVGQGWFEAFLKRTLIDNPHHVKLTMTASKTLGEERRTAEKMELAAIQAKWTPAEREKIMAECKALEAFQKKVDAPEDLAKLPRLSLKDIPEKGPVPESTTATVGGVKVIRAKTAANGIAYLELYFELAGFSAEELSDAAVLAGMLEELPTAKRSVLELKNALDAAAKRAQERHDTLHQDIQDNQAHLNQLHADAKETHDELKTQHDAFVASSHQWHQSFIEALREANAKAGQQNGSAATGSTSGSFNTASGSNGTVQTIADNGTTSGNSSSSGTSSATGASGSQTAASTGALTKSEYGQLAQTGIGISLACAAILLFAGLAYAVRMFAQYKRETSEK